MHPEEWRGHVLTGADARVWFLMTTGDMEESSVASGDPHCVLGCDLGAATTIARRRFGGLESMRRARKSRCVRAGRKSASRKARRVAAKAARRERREVMRRALADAGLCPRGDSRLCERYVRYGGDVVAVVDSIMEMDFYHGMTDYLWRFKEIMNRLDGRCARSTASGMAKMQAMEGFRATWNGVPDGIPPRVLVALGCSSSASFEGSPCCSELSFCDGEDEGLEGCSDDGEGLEGCSYDDEGLEGCSNDCEGLDDPRFSEGTSDDGRADAWFFEGVSDD